MTEFTLKQLPTGQIICEMEGEETEVAKLICRAMIGNVNIASMICGTIPTFLDEKKIDRKGFCEQIINGHGSKV